MTKEDKKIVKALLIKKIIYAYVKETYGEAEAENPSWDIVALANHLALNINQNMKG